MDLTGLPIAERTPRDITKFTACSCQYARYTRLFGRRENESAFFTQTLWIIARTTRNTESDYFLPQHLLICFCEEDAVCLLQRRGLIFGVNIYQSLDKFICGTYDNVSMAGLCGILKIKYIYISDKKNMGMKTR
jgi:hypothetical protein